MSELLKAEELVAGYDRTEVLRGVSFELRPGEIFAVLGTNGSGKTTLMRTVVGLLRARAGRVTIDGADVTEIPAEKRVAHGLTLAPEGRGIFATLSVEENLAIGGTPLAGRLGGARAAKQGTAEGLEYAYSLFNILYERRDLPASALSGGQQQMLAIARALMAKPKYLLLDEPCLGLSPKIAGEVYTVLGKLREEGLGVIVVEESARRALKAADRACVIKNGKKILEDDAQKILHDEGLLEAYFGITHEVEL